MSPETPRSPKAANAVSSEKLPPKTANEVRQETTGVFPDEKARGSVTALLPRSFRDCEIIEEIARGGMGVVFKAFQRSLNRPVAVKMILHGAFASPELLQRFEREARAAAVLDHPNIVPIYEFGQQDGHPYFIMPLIEGDNLATLVGKHGPRSPKEALALLIPVLDAVHQAHQAGIIHRDLKPENILVDRDGRPRVTDFGLAKHAWGEGMTVVGQILGTPAYMAPEQARGNSRRVGPQADVYALGGILYFLLSGRPPFQGASPTEILLQVEQTPATSLRACNPDIPEALDAVVLCCLQKDPAHRYHSAASLLEVARLLADSPLTASPASRPQTERLLQALRSDPISQLNPPAQRAKTGTELEPGIPPPPLPPRRHTQRLLLAAAMIGGILLTAAALLLPWSRLLDNSKPSDSTSPGSAEARIVLPKPSFKDFKLQVVTAGVSEVDGVLHSHVGDKLSLTITSERDAHLRVWFLNPNGDIIQLFPNSVESNDRVQAKVPRQLPGNDQWWIEADEASPEAGYLRIVASTEVWDPLPGDQTAGPFLVFQYLAAQQKKLQHSMSRWAVRRRDHEISEVERKSITAPALDAKK